MERLRQAAGKSEGPFVINSSKPNGRSTDTKMVISGGTAEPEALGRATCEWIVPALVRQFLAERASNGRNTTDPDMTATESASRGR